MSDQLAEYELLQSLEVETPGVVQHRARAVGDDGEVVVRQLVQPATDDAFERFAAELRAVHAVRSPNVVPVVDAGVHNGVLYTVAPWFVGGSLADRPAHADEDPPAMRRDLAMVADAADGVHALHEAGILHRNIRPSAMFRDGNVGSIGDLGLVQLLRPGVASTGFGPLGAMAYADPSVLRGHAAGRASEVWSLGATLHWVATGRLLFPGLENETVSAAVQAIAGGSPTIVTSEGTSLDAVIRRALAPEPGERQPTAADFADDLRRALQGD